MNLILLSDSDFITPNRVRLSGRRFTHIKDVLKAECAKTLTVGKINGLMGQGTVVGEKIFPPLKIIFPLFFTRGVRGVQGEFHRTRS